MVSDGVEYTAINLTISLGSGCAGRAVAQLRRTRGAAGPLLQLASGRIAERIVQPHRPEPPISLGVGYTHLLGPFRGELGNTLNVLQPLRRDDGPLRKRGP